VSCELTDGQDERASEKPSQKKKRGGEQEREADNEGGVAAIKLRLLAPAACVMCMPTISPSWRQKLSKASSVIFSLSARNGTAYHNRANVCVM
jgi:hypothetical protein